MIGLTESDAGSAPKKPFWETALIRIFDEDGRMVVEAKGVDAMLKAVLDAAYKASNEIGVQAGAKLYKLEENLSEMDLRNDACYMEADGITTGAHFKVEPNFDIYFQRDWDNEPIG